MGAAAAGLAILAGQLQYVIMAAPWLGLYVAARADHLAFNRVQGALMRLPWEAPVTRLEVGGGYYLLRNVIVRSSNYTLYGDLSGRVMSVLSQFTPNLEIYSIDEAFLGLAGFENRLEAHA